MTDDIYSDGILLARILRRDFKLNEGLNFLSSDKDLIQVGIWNHPNGKTLQAHKHNALDRNIVGTQELVFVISGKLHVDIYNLEDSLIQEVELASGDLCICIAGGHGYRIASEDTRVLEVKNGPYFGVEKDKTIIDSLCTDQEKIY